MHTFISEVLKANETKILQTNQKTASFLFHLDLARDIAVAIFDRFDISIDNKKVGELLLTDTIAHFLRHTDLRKTDDAPLLIDRKIRSRFNVTTLKVH